jgi:ABC-2 type transport system ATP-binding protein
MSTHTLSVAEELCDRIGIIKDGSLIFEGSIDSINELKENNHKKLETLFLEITS